MVPCQCQNSENMTVVLAKLESKGVRMREIFGGTHYFFRYIVNNKGLFTQEAIDAPQNCCGRARLTHTSAAAELNSVELFLCDAHQAVQNQGRGLHSLYIR